MREWLGGNLRFAAIFIRIQSRPDHSLRFTVLDPLPVHYRLSPPSSTLAPASSRFDVVRTPRLATIIHIALTDNASTRRLFGYEFPSLRLLVFETSITHHGRCCCYRRHRGRPAIHPHR